MSWEIVARPEGRNDNDKNEGGLVIELKGTAGREEIGRVAFERSNSANPDKTFTEALEEKKEAAKAAVKFLQELSENAGTLA